jgi:hypothetical protein
MAVTEIHQNCSKRQLNWSLHAHRFRDGGSEAGSVVDRDALAQVSSGYSSFPCQSFIPLISPQSSPSIIQSWYSIPQNDSCNSGIWFNSTRIPTNAMELSATREGPQHNRHILYITKVPYCSSTRPEASIYPYHEANESSPHNPHHSIISLQDPS